MRHKFGSTNTKLRIVNYYYENQHRIIDLLLSH